MPKETIIETKLKHDGIFDFKKLYNFCYDWFRDKGYDVNEANYSEKVTADGKEIELKWEIEKKVSDYYKFEITSKWRVVGLTTVEVEKNGKKLKMNKGNAEMKLAGEIVRDYEKRWEESPFLHFLRELYDKFITKTKYDKLKGKIFGDVDEHVAQVKSFLVLEGTR